MINYQIQYKLDSKDLKNEISICDGQLGIWATVSQHPTLKAAFRSAKTLIKKYGYDRIRICRATMLDIKVEVGN